MDDVPQDVKLPPINEPYMGESSWGHPDAEHANVDSNHYSMPHANIDNPIRGLTTLNSGTPQMQLQLQESSYYTLDAGSTSNRSSIEPSGRSPRWCFIEEEISGESPGGRSSNGPSGQSPGGRSFVGPASESSSWRSSNGSVGESPNFPTDNGLSFPIIEYPSINGLPTSDSLYLGSKRSQMDSHNNPNFSPPPVAPLYPSFSHVNRDAQATSTPATLYAANAPCPAVAYPFMSSTPPFNPIPHPDPGSYTISTGVPSPSRASSDNMGETHSPSTDSYPNLMTPDSMGTMSQYSAWANPPYNSNHGGQPTINANTAIGASSSATISQQDPIETPSHSGPIEKPVHVVPMGSESDLNTDVRDLYTQLEQIQHGNLVFPAEAQDELILHQPLVDHNQDHISFFDHRPWARENGLLCWDAKDEFNEFLKIVRSARQRISERHARSSWNSSVHEPLLNIALRSLYGKVRNFNVYDASISPMYLPTNGLYPIGNKNLVDYCIAFDDHKITAYVRDFLRKKAGHFESINHTDYWPLKDRPIAISIVVKDPEDANYNRTNERITAWSRAHVKLLTELRESKLPLRPIDTSLPVITIDGSKWRLSFVSDIDDAIIRYDALEIGSTDTVIGIYKLAASLRLLGKWAHQHYFGWLMDHVLLPGP